MCAVQGPPGIQRGIARGVRAASQTCTAVAAGGRAPARYCILYIMSYHIMSYHIIHIVLHWIALYRILLYRILLYSLASHFIITQYLRDLHHAVASKVQETVRREEGEGRRLDLSHHIISCHVLSCHHIIYHFRREEGE